MTVPKKIINDPSDGVSELIEGLLYTYPQSLQKLDQHNVLLRSNYSNNNSYDGISLLSGGGSGHEPAHAGFIGDGMLTGAILGGIFASPAVHSILAAIRAVTTSSSSSSSDSSSDNSNSNNNGCLLIVKNYTGDRLNFGMACEMAVAEKRNVKMVVVSDDCAVPRNKGVTGSRGVAGTLFVHKIAGAASKDGSLNLEQIADLATYAASRILSLGVALDAVTIPGAKTKNDRLGEHDMEVGLGIHGEAGIRQCPMGTADSIAKEMIDTIVDFGYYCNTNNNNIHELQYLKENDKVAILVNNLGGLSNFEMAILTRSLVQYLETQIKCFVTRVYAGTFMTSFDMQGASVSVLILDDDDDENGKNLSMYLDEETNAPAWTKADVHLSTTSSRPSLTPRPEVVVAPTDDTTSIIISKPFTTTIDSLPTLISASITSACHALIDAEPELTNWDTIVGDGDCGMTMKRGATEILHRLDSGSLTVDHPVILFRDLADAVSASMGGTSGILFELFFRNVSTSLMQSMEGDGNTSNTNNMIDANSFQTAFHRGIDAIAFYGGAKVGFCTMLDALVPASDILRSTKSWDRAVDAAMTGAKSTEQIVEAGAGRSTYLSEEQLRGTPDPGAMAVAFVMKAIGDVVL